MKSYVPSPFKALDSARELGKPFGLTIQEQICGGKVRYVIRRRGVFVGSTFDYRKLKALVVKLMPGENDGRA